MLDGKLLLVFIGVIIVLAYLIKKAFMIYNEYAEDKRRYGDEPLFKEKSGYQVRKFM